MTNLNLGHNADIKLFKKQSSHHITDIMSDAREYASINNMVVQFRWYAGLTVRVSATTRILDLYRDYKTSQYMNWNLIGPDTVCSYSSELKQQIHQRKLLEQSYCFWNTLNAGVFHSGQFGFNTVTRSIRGWFYHFGWGQPKTLLPNPALA